MYNIIEIHKEVLLKWLMLSVTHASAAVLAKANALFPLSAQGIQNIALMQIHASAAVLVQAYAL
jgi:hypothetical protein